MRILGLIALVSMTACLFNADETRGWPCENDNQCGRNEQCEDGICGGLEALDPTTGADSSDSNGTSTTSTSTSTSTSTTGTPGCTIEPQCASSSTIRGCDGNEEVVLACADVCDTPSLGCAPSVAQGQDLCYCGPDFGSCSTEGSRLCNGGALNVCMSGTWEAYDCDALCIADGFSSAFCGSDPDSGNPICLCGDGSCSEGAAYCTGDNTVNICSNGFYSSYTCDSLCGGTASLGCGSAPEGDTCFCGT